MPRTVVDAVLACVHRLTLAAREAVEQLAVFPTQVAVVLIVVGLLGRAVDGPRMARRARGTDRGAMPIPYRDVP